MADRQFSPADIERILAETFIQQVDYQHEIGSTNDQALQLAKESTSVARLLTLADEQTAGRGRGANSWWAANGALTCSVLLKADAIVMPQSRWPQLAMVTGLAVADAVEDCLGDSAVVALKWPNDVYLRNRKVCGILVETADGQNARLILGIGINVNNRSDAAPIELRDKAISLCEVTERRLALADVLIGVLRRLEERLSWIVSCESELQDEWRRRCLLTGREVQIETDSRQLIGTCVGINADGALLLETGNGCETCLSGVVTQWD
jgi:BirA family biotin operon repressor/biotin-[acetyl-CoA-carboxylase] ligase